MDETYIVSVNCCDSCLLGDG